MNIRYNPWVRKILLWISDYIFEEQILEYLYPEDCLISFGDGG